jgi:hypothetical protein
LTTASHTLPENYIDGLRLVVWLSGFTSTFKNQVATMLVRWSDISKDTVYRVDDPASNYAEAVIQPGPYRSGTWRGAIRMELV